MRLSGIEGLVLSGCILVTCGCGLNPASEAGRALYSIEKQADHIYSIDFVGRFDYRSEDALSWNARGSGEWKTLTPRQIRGFFARKAQALQVLEATPATGLQRELLEALRIDVLIGAENASSLVPDAYRVAIRSFPDSVLIRAAYFSYLLPRWYGSQEELDALVAEAKRNYERNPALIRLQALHSIEIGDQLNLSGKPEDALNAYQQAIALSPGLVKAYVRRGQLLEAHERYAEAIAVAKTALRLDPYSAAALRILAKSLYRSGAPVEALIAADHLTRIAPEDAAAFALRASVQYAMRMYAEAEVSYERAAQLDNGDPYYRHMVRRAAFQLGVRQQRPPNLATVRSFRALRAS